MAFGSASSIFATPTPAATTRTLFAAAADGSIGDGTTAGSPVAAVPNLSALTDLTGFTVDKILKAFGGVQAMNNNVSNPPFRGKKLTGKQVEKLYALGVRNFREAVLAGADLTGAVLTGAVLTEAKLTRAVLAGAILYGAILTEAKLTRAVLTDADLRGADLTGAVLAGADLTNADLRGANLKGANLRGADLTGVYLAQIVFGHTKIDAWTRFPFFFWLRWFSFGRKHPGFLKELHLYKKTK